MMPWIICVALGALLQWTCSLAVGGWEWLAVLGSGPRSVRGEGCFGSLACRSDWPVLLRRFVDLCRVFSKTVFGGSVYVAWTT